jgi:hypothetical protein
VHLTGLRRQQMLERPKDKLNPVASTPPADQWRCTQCRFQTQQIETVLARFIHDHDGHLAIGRARRSQTNVAYPGLPRMLPPVPVLAMEQVMPFDRVSISSGEGIGRLPLHKHGALLRLVHMLHALRVAQPTLRHHHGRGQVHTAPPQRRQALIQHPPRPWQLVPARRPRPTRIGPSNGQVHGDDQATIANDHQQQEPVNAREYACVLATPPPADETQLLSILVKHRVIPAPGPLPATLGGWALVRHMTPERLSHLQSQAPQPLEPGPFRQRPQYPRGPGQVPAPDTTELRGGPTAEEGRNHHPHDLAQELVWAP